MINTFYRNPNSIHQRSGNESIDYDNSNNNQAPMYSSIERQINHDQRMSATAEAIDNLKRLSDSIKMKI